MATRVATGIAATIVMLAAGSAVGQVLVTPKFFFWGKRTTNLLPDPYGQGDPGPVHDARCIELVHTSTSTYPDPVAAADAIVSEAMARIAAGRVPSTQVSIIIQNFGHDHDGSESGSNQSTRFFQEADRLENLLPTLTIDGDPVNDLQLPGSGAWVDMRRTYRHPFLYQNQTTSSTATLKNWMTSFAARYKALQLQNPAIPNPVRFTFDTEAYIYLQPAAANVKMLYILRKGVYAGQEGYIWNNWVVPGNAVPGQPSTPATLANLYNYAKVQYGWPNDILNGIDETQSADYPDNRQFMLWYYNIAQRAKDAQMRAAAYDVVRSATLGWGPSCKVGNYADARYDGQIDSTGWFMDRVDNVSFARFAADDYPRSHIERQPAGGTMAPVIASSFDPLRRVRWIAEPRWSSGDHDSPALYQLKHSQWLGYSGLGWNRPIVQGGPDGHQQPNLYLPPGPNGPVLDATPFETALRLARHDVESILNSTGSSPGRLAPWLEMAHTRLLPESHLVTKREMRSMLAMLRAKNIHEARFWNNWFGFDQVSFDVAWDWTVRAVQSVYASKVLTFARTTGSMPPNSPVDDTAMLEFTLRDSQTQAPRTVNILSVTDPTGASGPMTEMIVKFEGLGAYPSSGTAGFNYEFRVECQVDHAATKGLVQVWNFMGAGGGQWMTIATEEGDSTYQFYTNDLTSRRLHRHVQNHGSAIEIVSPTGQVWVKLVHHSEEPFMSKYDLVQVTPYRRPDLDPANGESDPATESDANYDGEVTESDLVHYLANWSEGALAADSNMDEQVDDADLLRFLNAYVTGT